MMDLNLLDRDMTGELIAFVRRGWDSFYCIAAVEYFVGEYWPEYVNPNPENIEDEYFHILKQFRVDYYELHGAYRAVIALQDELALCGNAPKLFIDFDARYFASNFQEQELESRIPVGWNGENVTVGNLIPEEFKYWSPYNSRWI